MKKKEERERGRGEFTERNWVYYIFVDFLLLRIALFLFRNHIQLTISGTGAAAQQQGPQPPPRRSVIMMSRKQ